MRKLKDNDEQLDFIYNSIKEYDEMSYFMEEPYFVSHQFGLIKPIKTVEITTSMRI